MDCWDSRYEFIVCRNRAEERSSGCISWEGWALELITIDIGKFESVNSGRADGAGARGLAVEVADVARSVVEAGVDVVEVGGSWTRESAPGSSTLCLDRLVAKSRSKSSSVVPASSQGRLPLIESASISSR